VVRNSPYPTGIVVAWWRLHWQSGRKAVRATLTRVHSTRATIKCAGECAGASDRALFATRWRFSCVEGEGQRQVALLPISNGRNCGDSAFGRGFVNAPPSRYMVAGQCIYIVVGLSGFRCICWLTYQINFTKRGKTILSPVHAVDEFSGVMCDHQSGPVLRPSFCLSILDYFSRWTASWFG